MPTRDALKLTLTIALVAFVPGATAQDQAAAIGKQRAIDSTIEWEVRDAGHPALGNIRFAYIKRPVETKAGSATVYSRAYLSCQKDKRSFAIELANAMAPADPGGLKPAADPRLFCQRPEGAQLLKEEILASWEINPKIGDALSRGLRAFPLRECAAITVQQEVNLPDGSPQKTARIEFEILPYDREIDSVFATCGERSAYGPTPPPVVAAAKPASKGSAPPPKTQPAAKTQVAAAPAKASPSPPPAKAEALPPPNAEPLPSASAELPSAKAELPPPKAEPPAAAKVETAPPAAAKAAAPAPEGGWREARSTPAGRTNVRAGPSLQSKIVTELHPGSVVLVQKTATEWWRARPSRGSAWEGYIRQDRLTFR